jgi:hypothetical protein
VSHDIAKIPFLNPAAMWTCSQCKEVMEDQFDSCWKCASVKKQSMPQLLTPMPALLNKPPFFGVLSLVAPLIAVGFIFIFAPHVRSGGGNWGWEGFAVLMIVAFLFFLFGFISSVVGLVRSERFCFLSILGFLLNGLVIVYLLAH